MNFVPAVAYHICLNLPAAFSQPRASLIVKTCVYARPRDNCNGASSLPSKMPGKRESGEDKKGMRRPDWEKGQTAMVRLESFGVQNMLDIMTLDHMTALSSLNVFHNKGM